MSPVRTGWSRLWPALLNWAYVVFLCVTLFGTGWLSWDSLYSLPHHYDTLEQRGVRVLAEGEIRQTGGRVQPEYALLRYEYRGRRLETDVSQNIDQFHYDGAVLEPVPLLVDPQDPDTAFTIADVHRRTNAGLGWRLAYTGSAFVLCLVLLVYESGLVKRLKARFASTVAADVPARDPLRPRPPMSPVEAVDELLELVRSGRPLPQGPDVRVDRDALRRAAFALRATTGTGTPRSPQTATLLDTFDELVRAGDTGPLITTALIDAQAATSVLPAIREQLLEDTRV